ncbi:50S ribosomal protein L15 [bacterium]|nr:50S ribosomal protein L15 [bacterium]
MDLVSGNSKKRRRVGRGNGSGKGTFCGRGMNGQNSRSGGGVRRGFEGGQMPLFRRLPKRGFNSRVGRRKKYFDYVNVGELDVLEASGTIDIEFLKQKRRVAPNARRVKILGAGEVTGAYEVRAHAFSAGAAKKIEAAGGKAVVV